MQVRFHVSYPQQVPFAPNTQKAQITISFIPSSLPHPRVPTLLTMPQSHTAVRIALSKHMYHQSRNILATSGQAAIWVNSASVKVRFSRTWPVAGREFVTAA